MRHFPRSIIFVLLILPYGYLHAEISFPIAGDQVPAYRSPDLKKIVTHLKNGDWVVIAGKPEGQIIKISSVIRSYKTLQLAPVYIKNTDLATPRNFKTVGKSEKIKFFTCFGDHCPYVMIDGAGNYQVYIDNCGSCTLKEKQAACSAFGKNASVVNPIQSGIASLQHISGACLIKGKLQRFRNLYYMPESHFYYYKVSDSKVCVAYARGIECTDIEE